MSDMTNNLVKPPFLELHTKKTATNYLLPLTHILSFSQAEENVSDNYFDPGSLDTDIEISNSFCLWNVNKILSIWKNYVLNPYMDSHGYKTRSKAKSEVNQKVKNQNL